MPVFPGHAERKNRRFNDIPPEGTASIEKHYYYFT
jgi:hypothetical protein